MKTKTTTPDAFCDDHGMSPAQLLDALFDSARTEMDANGLTDWRLCYEVGQVERLGGTCSERKEIRLSADWMLVLSGAQRLNTVRHEIAHALVSVKGLHALDEYGWAVFEAEGVLAREVDHLASGGKLGHGPLWRAQAVALGANPSPTTDTGSLLIAPVIGTCGGGHHFARQRMPKTSLRYFCANAVHGGTRNDESRITWTRNTLDRSAARAAASKHPVP